MAVSGSTICAGWNDAERGSDLNKPIQGFGFSATGGAVFSDQGMLPFGTTWPEWDPPEYSIAFADPSLVHRPAGGAEEGRFVFITLDGRRTVQSGAQSILLYDSADCAGFSYRGRVAVPNGPSAPYDKPMMAVDANQFTPGGPPNSLYRRLYVASSRLPAQALRMTYSDSPFTQVEGWAWTSEIANVRDTGRQLQGAWPAAAPNGDVFVAYVEADFVASTASIRLASSTTGGAVWSPRSDISTAKPLPKDSAASEQCGNYPALRGNIRLLPFPQIAITPDPNASAGYVIHAVYTYDPGPVGGDVADVFYRRSLDGGYNWEAERRMNDDATSTDQWGPSLGVAPGGYVAVSWYDRRLDPSGNTYFDRFLAASGNGGVSWSANLRVSDVSSPVSRNDPHVNGLAECYHGEYDQMAVTQSALGSAVHIVWSDDRRVFPGCPSDPNNPNDPYLSGCPNPDVYYDAVQDFDSDGWADAMDPCPTVVNAGLDVDADGVDDACDTCTSIANLPVAGTSVPTNRTLISRQYDDDADGRGSACDFDYDNAGAVVAACDFNQIQASIGKLMTASNCGTPPDENCPNNTNNQQCGEFDHDGIGAVVTAADFNLAKAAVGEVISSAFPKCAVCSQGTGWSNVIGSGGERDGRPVCESAVAGLCTYAP